MDMPMVQGQLGKVNVWSGLLTKAAILWFWLTMLSALYFGMVQILPVLYQDYVLTLHQTFCHFLFVEILLNWICIRLAQSPFDPASHAKYMSSHAAEIKDSGFEIDLSHLRGPKSNDPRGGGTYSLPAASVRAVDGNPCKRWNRDTMYIIALHPENPCCLDERVSGASQAERVVYPYWSWKPCVVCQTQRPPRAHHCHLCNVCVLKRDHHCFFTGCCIGLRNQRHFVIFTFYASLAIAYSILHCVAYILLEYLVSNSPWDLLLPVTVIRVVLGYISVGLLFRVLVLYSLVWFLITAFGFLVEQARIIRRGATSFEEENGIKIGNLASVEENVAAVFGRRWYLNFLVPLHCFFPPTDNGITWNHIKA